MRMELAVWGSLSEPCLIWASLHVLTQVSMTVESVPGPCPAGAGLFSPQAANGPMTGKWMWMPAGVWDSTGAFPCASAGCGVRAPPLQSSTTIAFMCDGIRTATQHHPPFQPGSHSLRTSFANQLSNVMSLLRSLVDAVCIGEKRVGLRLSRLPAVS